MDKTEYCNVLEEYSKLIESFVSGEIGVRSFEQAYFAKFKAESVFFPEEIFYTLNSLFGALDEVDCRALQSGELDRLKTQCQNTLKLISSHLVGKTGGR